MASSTSCQTPDAIFHISISELSISVEVTMPAPLSLEDNEAELLEINLHNAVELVLARYFPAAQVHPRLPVYEVDSLGPIERGPLTGRTFPA